MRSPLLLLAALAAIPALAFGASTIPLPRERPSAITVTVPPLPRERPVAVPEAATSSEPAAPSEAPSTETPSSEPPTPQPPRDFQVACPAVMMGQVTAKSLPPIHEGQCGLQSPLLVSAVTANGRSIPLDVPVTTDCGMATALPAWIAEVDSYAVAHDNTRLGKIDIGANYECRTVDHLQGGSLSFHAFADALDVLAFTLADGTTLTLKESWHGTPAQGSALWHFAHDSACGHFMTVLGPDADSFHQDNLHIDLGCHGKLCTARYCQ